MSRPRCGNDPRAQLTDGDRQAVGAFKAYLADRATLRDRIAAAIWERQNPGRRWADCEYRWRADAEADADAVMTVLPPPVPRADVYAEVADRLAADAETGDKEGLTRIYRRSAARKVREWGEELRRLADETPDTEAHPPTHTWKIESPRRDTWTSWGTTYDDRDWALERYESATSTAAARPFRLVRATTTYTVEAEHTPAARAPQDEAQP